MVYYKIPLTGGLDYPAGCILLCAYTYGGYEYCKFERVTEIGSGWVAITEAEFNVRCPEFPMPEYTGEIESSDHPGCFYRMVNGEKEWRNPPMLIDTEYRTMERHNGMPVYTKLFRKSFDTSGSYHSHLIGTYPLDALVIEMSGVQQSSDVEQNILFSQLPSFTTDGKYSGGSLGASNTFIPDAGAVFVNLLDDSTYDERDIFSVTIKYTKQ